MRILKKQHNNPLKFDSHSVSLIIFCQVYYTGLSAGGDEGVV